MDGYQRFEDFGPDHGADRLVIGADRLVIAADPTHLVTETGLRTERAGQAVDTRGSREPLDTADQGTTITG